MEDIYFCLVIWLVKDEEALFYFWIFPLGSVRDLPADSVSFVSKFFCIMTTDMDSVSLVFRFLVMMDTDTNTVSFMH